MQAQNVDSSKIVRSLAPIGGDYSHLLFSMFLLQRNHARGRFKYLLSFVEHKTRLMVILISPWSMKSRTMPSQKIITYSRPCKISTMMVTRRLWRQLSGRLWRFLGNEPRWFNCWNFIWLSKIYAATQESCCYSSYSTQNFIFATNLLLNLL